MRARLVGQREHEAAHRRGIAGMRRREGLCDHYPEAAPAVAVCADLAQLWIRELAAESAAHQPPDSRIVGGAGDAEPQRAGGPVAGAPLRLLERLAARDQARYLVEAAALDERRVGGARESAVGGSRAVDGANGVGAREGRPEQ